MTTRRRFTADFKAKVALEALHGDKTIQEIATLSLPFNHSGPNSGSNSPRTCYAIPNSSRTEGATPKRPQNSSSASVSTKKSTSHRCG